jgi:hypothetical protein
MEIAFGSKVMDGEMRPGSGGVTTGPQVITSVHSSWQANSLGKVWRFSVQACGLHHIACYH